MKLRLPRQLLWTDKQSLKELFDHPLNKDLFNLYMALDSGRIKSILPPHKVMNEAYYQCTRAVFYNSSRADRHELESDIKENLGLKQGTQSVLIQMYAILAWRKNNTQETEAYKGQLESYISTMPESKGPLDFIKQFQACHGKMVIDLSPKPYPATKLTSLSVCWPEVTNHFTYDTIKQVVNLWKDKNEKLRVVNLIEEAFQIAMTGGDPLKFEYGNEGCNMVSLDLSRLKKEILTGKLAGKAHEKVESGCSKVKGCTTKERSFTLPKILEYTKDHCNLNTAPTIISMLNYFLRNAEDSTQEEKNMVDEVERMMLHPDRGDQVTGNKSSFTENAQQVNFTFPSGISAKELMANFPKILKQLKKSRNG